MRKPSFLTNERLSRLVVSLFLCEGLLLPLTLAFGAESSLLGGVLISVSLLLVLTLLGSLKRGQMIIAISGAVACAVQFLLPNMGFFGSAYECLKALALYFSGVTGAVAMFSQQTTLFLGVMLALMSYAFSSRNVGFLPSAIVVVLTLFLLWSIGQAAYLWYATPALIAILLLVSQNSHEKVNLFEVLPMAAIVVALAMLILPQSRTTLAPLHDAAMDLKQTITDYLFFTEPRNVFTLGSYGYYPMGSGRLGGPAEPSEYPVMTVKTDRRTLLRGVVKDEYTGRSWRDTSSGRRYLYVNPRWASLRNSVFLEGYPPAAVRSASPLLSDLAINIQMQNQAASTVFAPAYLRSFSAQHNMVAYFNEASELFITRDLERDDRYTVYAPVFEGGDSNLGALVNAAPKGGDEAYADAISRYTQLPEHLEPTLYSDLAQIIASAETPYDQASAIMRHLKRYYRYTLTPDEPPDNQDFVTYFLYVGREGYCTYFASAMTILCRMAGLPARYVEGFSAEPGADGFAYVTGLNAHAWTEVYFEGFGWAPFDPTPAQQNLDNPNEQNNQQNEEPEPTPSPEPPPPDEQPTPSPEPDEEPDEQPTEQPTEQPEPDTPPEPENNEPPFPWWWIVLAVAAIGALCTRIVLCMPDRVAKRKANEQEKLFVYGSAAATLLRLNKRAPRAGETPLLFARRMDRQKALPASILPLWRLMAMSNYSRTPVDAAQTSRARDAFMKLWKPQHAFTKLRFMLLAAFGKTCYTALDTQLAHEEPKPKYNYRARLEEKTKRKARKGRKHPPRPPKEPDDPKGGAGAKPFMPQPMAEPHATIEPQAPPHKEANPDFAAEPPFDSREAGVRPHLPVRPSDSRKDAAPSSPPMAPPSMETLRRPTRRRRSQRNDG